MKLVPTIRANGGSPVWYLRGLLALIFVLGVGSVAAIGSSPAHAEARTGTRSSDSIPADVVAPVTATTTTTDVAVPPLMPVPVTPDVSDPHPAAAPTNDAVELIPPAAVAAVPPASDCPVAISGHWTGVWASWVFQSAGGTIDQRTEISGNAISGTVGLTGSVYGGGDVVGTLNCRQISLGFVIGVAIFEGTLSADGLSATGTYIADAIGDRGTWSVTFVPESVPS